MKVAIRVDGSSYIGMGHIVRSLALAAAAERAGHSVVFGSRFEQGVTRIQEQGYPLTRWNSGTPDGPGLEYEPAGDTEEVLHWLRKESPDALITDSYRVDAEYFKAVKPLVACHYYIDDVNRLTANVDGVVNGNIGAETWDYSRFGHRAKLLLGCRYNLIRPEFRNLEPFTVHEETKAVLITAGGGKPGPVLSFLARSLLEDYSLDRVKVVVIAQGQSADMLELEKYAAVEPRLILKYNVKHMVSVMQECDLAISAGGSTVYELSAVGVPRLIYVLADNQNRIASEMEKAGLAVNLGPIQQITTLGLLAEVKKRLIDYEWRKRTSMLGRQLVDGYGSDRVIDDIGNFLGNNEGGGKK